jgi:hypothetical protein
MPSHAVRDDQQAAAGRAHGLFFRGRQSAEILILGPHFPHIGPQDRLDDKPACG